MNNVKAIILAAGKGTRMKSPKAKVLHEVLSVPMIHHVLASLSPLNIMETVVVTGHQAGKVEASLAGHDVVFARQVEQLGTAHAVLAAREFYQTFGGTVMILCGDTPLIRSSTLKHMLAEHVDSGSPVTVMSTVLTDPANYGRIIVGANNEVVGIVEEKDASASQKKIHEINAGVYCVESSFLCESLGRIGSENSQGEFYLTDLVGLATAAGYAVNRYLCSDPVEVLGVNSPIELAEAEKELRLRNSGE